MDNYNWIRDAEKNRLVVGTQARILYQDAEGRLKIALESVSYTHLDVYKRQVIVLLREIQLELLGQE